MAEAAQAVVELEVLDKKDKSDIDLPSDIDSPPPTQGKKTGFAFAQVVKKAKTANAESAKAESANDEVVEQKPDEEGLRTNESEKDLELVANESAKSDGAPVSEKEAFWARAKHFGLNPEDYEKQEALMTTRVKKCWDWSVPLVCMILIWAASSDQIPPLASPRKCSVSSANDLACFSLPDAEPQVEWAGRKSNLWIQNEGNITTTDPAALNVTVFNSAKTIRLCTFDYESTRKYSTGQSMFYSTTTSGWKTVLSFIPFVVIFQGILGLNLSSRIVAPFGMIVTLLLGLNFFRDADYFNGDAVAEALGKVGIVILDRFWWTLIEYAISVFTAFFFLRVLQLWGVVDSMRREFESIAPTDNRKVMIVAFCFAVALAVVAPGGSNFVIAGSILISMNLSNTPNGSEERLNSNLNIGAIALFGNAVTSAFNLLGICVVTLAEDISELDPLGRNPEQATLEVGKWFTLQYIFFGAFSPLMMVFLFRPENGILAKLKSIPLADYVLCIVVGSIFGVMQWVIAAYLGPELPCLIGGGVPLVLYTIFEKRNSLSCSLPTWTSLKQRRYMLPFIILIVILLIYGSKDVETALTGKGSSAFPYLSPVVFNINSGDVSFSRKFSYLYDSGVVIFFIAIATPFILPYVPTSNDDVTQVKTGNALGNAYTSGNHRTKAAFRRHAKKALLQARAATAFVPDKHRIAATLKTAFKEAWDDVVPVLITITSFASIARLMGYFQMTQAIALFIVSIFRGAAPAYAFFLPVIGMLGSGLTGSTTTSNFLFARLQIRTCTQLGLAPVKNSVFKVAALQMLGASAGEIISPMNAVVITLMDGISGGEAPLMKRCLPVFVAWLLCTMIVSVLFLSA